MVSVFLPRSSASCSRGLTESGVGKGSMQLSRGWGRVCRKRKTGLATGTETVYQEIDLGMFILENILPRVGRCGGIEN